MSFTAYKEVNGLRLIYVLILILTFFFGGGLGNKWGQELVRTELGDRRSDSQVVGWCVKTNVEGMQGAGAPHPAIVQALPGISEWCANGWSEFKVWVDEQIEVGKERERAARSSETE